MDKKPLHVLIVDDHQLIRDGLAALLTSEKNIVKISFAGRGEEAVTLLTQLHPSLVLLDLNMPGCGGIEAARKMFQLEPTIKIIIISSYNAAVFPLKLMEIGAHGYLYKDSSPHTLLEAITQVTEDHTYLDPRIAQTITLDQLDDDKHNPFAQLSVRELQIVLLLIHSMSISRIAESLTLHPKTVCGYRYTLFDKLHINSDVELIQLAYQHKLLAEPPSLNI